MENGGWSSGFTYKTEFFSAFGHGQAQFFDSTCGRQEALPVLIIAGQLQHVATAMLGQFGWQHQELLPNRLDGGLPIFLGQAQTFEPMDQIISQQQQLQKRDVGQPFVRGDFVQRKVIQQFPDGTFHIGTPAIGFPYHPGLQVQIGHQAGITVAALGEERELLGFLRVFGQRATDHNEAVFGRPALRLETKFCHRPTAGQLLETRVLGQGQIAFGFGANNNIAAARLIQIVHQPARKETCIGQPTNTAAGNRRGHFLQTPRHQGPCSRVGGGIARPQRAVPKLLPMGFEAQQRMVGGRPFFWGLYPSRAPCCLPYKVKTTESR